MRYQKMLNPEDRMLSQDAKKFINEIRALQPQIKEERPITTYPTNIARFISFEGIRALDLQRFGEKVQLSDKTIEELIMATIKDPTDTSYMREGRPQRLIRQKVNLAQNNLDIQSKIDVVKQALEQKLVATPADIQNLSVAIQTILGRMEDKLLTDNNLNIIIQAVRTIGLQNAQSTTLSNTKQFYSASQFIAQKTELLSYMIAKNTDRNSFVFTTDAKGKTVSVISMANFLILVNNEIEFLRFFNDKFFDINDYTFKDKSLILADVDADPDTILDDLNTTQGATPSAPSGSTPVAPSSPSPPSGSAQPQAPPTPLKDLKNQQKAILQRIKDIEDDVQKHSSISAKTFRKKGVSGVPAILKEKRQVYTDLKDALAKVVKAIKDFDDDA